MNAPDAAGEEIRTLVKRLARPHSDGGNIVERAVLLASGTDLGAVLAWIADHGGVAEVTGVEASQRGLHSPGVDRSADAWERAPRRYVLPAGALD
jgi:hypothetical protein